MKDAQAFYIINMVRNTPSYLAILEGLLFKWSNIADGLAAGSCSMIGILMSCVSQSSSAGLPS